MSLFNPDLFASQVLPIDKFCPFDTINGKKTRFPSKSSKAGKLLIKKANDCIDFEIPILPLSQYIRFAEDGNRKEYETPYFSRRQALKDLMLGELCEKQGRFIPKIMDILFAICEESTWVIPAHNHSAKNHLNVFHAKMPETLGENIWNIDLFSAATGALVAVCHYLFYDEFEKRIPELFNDRLYYELEKRLVKPYLNTTELWWMGYNRKGINNWNIWINLNMLTICAFAVKDDKKRFHLSRKIAESANLYYDSMPTDGGCDEGPSYWGKAGACLAMFAELAYCVTGKKCNVFGDEKLGKIVDYIRKVNIADNYYVNCADGHPICRPNGTLLRRYGKLFGNEKLTRFGNDLLEKCNFDPLIDPSLAYSVILTLSDMQPDKTIKKYEPDKVTLFEKLELALLRETDDSNKGFFVGIKGGHNAESHNHLDVGNYIVYCDGRPVIIDAGVGTYTKFTFINEYRYNMFAFRTQDHTLPLINGKGQWIERIHHADNFSLNKEQNTVSMELKEAYVNKDEIKSFERTLKFDNETITVSDKLLLNSCGFAEFFIPIYNKPEKLSDTVFKIDENAYIEFSRGFDITFEEIKFEIPSFVADWNRNEMYKFSIKTKENSSQISLQTKITHKKPLGE